MIKNFKFFHGIEDKLFVSWRPEHNVEDLFGIDAEAEITRLLSQQIAEEIDNEIINELSRRINGGQTNRDGGFEGDIQRFSDNVDYFNRWMDIGGNRA